jgi:hypothetical protein
MRAGDIFWRGDRGLTALLAFLVLGLLVWVPLVATGVLSPLFVEIAFSLILISGVASVKVGKVLAVAIYALAVLAIGTKGVLLAFPSVRLRLLDAMVSLLAILVLTVIVLARVFQKGPITLYRVQGAVAAYLLLGLAWTMAYELSLLVSPDAIRFPEGSGAVLLQVPRLLYFSFVTLTTVGYGDIVPVHPAVRSLAMTEALVGQLYPAVLIARLVSLEIVSRREPR